MGKIYMRIPDGEKKKDIEALCGRLGMEVGILNPSDLGRTLSEIILGKKSGNGSHANPPILYVLPELLVFFGLTEAELDSFLLEYRKAGIEPVARKAVVTPSNLQWTLYELAEELGREHMALH